jgi:hypothetical protein
LKRNLVLLKEKMSKIWPVSASSGKSWVIEQA